MTDEIERGRLFAVSHSVGDDDFPGKPELAAALQKADELADALLDFHKARAAALSGKAAADVYSQFLREYPLLAEIELAIHKLLGIKPSSAGAPKITETRTGTKFEGSWGQVEVHDDGSLSAKSKAATIETDGDGKIKVKMDNISKVAIDNIADLAGYELKQSEGAVSHHVVWRNGGDLRLTFRRDGKILEFRAEGVETA